MKRLVMLAVAVALAVPVAAAATGTPDRGEQEKGNQAKKTYVVSGLFASVAEQVCRERLRPFLASDDAEKAVDQGKRRCAKRLLRHEWKLARAVLVCTDRLAETESLNRRTLAECLVSVLTRRVEDAKPKVTDEDQAREAAEKAKLAEKAAREKAAKEKAAQAYAAALASCKEQAGDPDFAETHEGLSFVEFYSEGDDADEYHALKRCVKSELEAADE